MAGDRSLQVVVVDIRGRLNVYDPRDGRIVRDPVPLFGRGYRDDWQW